VTHEIKISHDLRPLFGPVRDQGHRPTCLAFAASDAHASARDGWVPLSCEFAFYRAQQRGMRPPSAGATLPHMLDALRHDGQPHEAGWPYLSSTPTDTASWYPPTSQGSSLFGRNGQSSPASFGAAGAYLAAGHPVMLLITLSDSFFAPNAEGVVVPGVGEAPQPSMRHAVIGVARGLVDGEDAILVRNSWGQGWGLAGHAWVTEAFVSPRLFALAVLGEEVDVPSYSAAA
jgi:hypothetical protein